MRAVSEPACLASQGISSLVPRTQISSSSRSISVWTSSSRTIVWRRLTGPGPCTTTSISSCTRPTSTQVGAWVCSVDLARLTATRISCTTSSARVSAGRVSFPIARTTSSGWATTISTSQTRRFKVPQSRSVPTGRVGFEASYDLAVTAIFTPDIQVIGPAQKRQLVHGGIVERIGSATVLGVRLRIAF